MERKKKVGTGAPLIMQIGRPECTFVRPNKTADLAINDDAFADAEVAAECSATTKTLTAQVCPRVVAKVGNEGREKHNRLLVANHARPFADLVSHFIITVFLALDQYDFAVSMNRKVGPFSTH